MARLSTALAFLLISITPASYASPTPSQPKVATSIPLTRGIHPSKRFTTDAEKAAWLSDISNGLKVKYGATDAPAAAARLARRGFGENELINSVSLQPFCASRIVHHRNST